RGKDDETLRLERLILITPRIKTMTNHAALLADSGDPALAKLAAPITLQNLAEANARAPMVSPGQGASAWNAAPSLTAKRRNR
ncbi:MAG TPA: hypothetical protein VGG24_08800, partial [Paraburkholderia sp.]